MTLTAAGAISLSNVQTEFGGANPIGLNEYYKGGAYVLSSAIAPNVPTSGTISMSNFYSAAVQVNFVANYTFDENLTGWSSFSYNGSGSYVPDVNVASRVNNRLRLTSLGPTEGWPYASYTMTGLTVGQTYKLTVDLYNNSFYVTILNNGTIIAQSQQLAATTGFVLTFRADFTSFELRIQLWSGVLNDYLEIDNVIVQPIIAATAWTPASITPTLWIKADSANWNGTSLISWKSADSGVRTITTNGGSRGTAANGIYSLNYAGDYQYSYVSMPQVTPTSGYMTVVSFFRVTSTASSANGVLIGGGDWGGYTRLAVYGDYTARNASAFTDGYWGVGPHTSWDTGSMAMGMWRSQVNQLGAANLARLNGIGQTLSNNVTGSAPTYGAAQWSVGCVYYAGESLYGDLAEVIVFNKILTTTQIQQCEGYLHWKYGQQALLPADHPYKNVAP